MKIHTLMALNRHYNYITFFLISCLPQLVLSQGYENWELVNSEIGAKLYKHELAYNTYAIEVDLNQGARLKFINGNQTSTGDIGYYGCESPKFERKAIDDLWGIFLEELDNEDIDMGRAFTISNGAWFDCMFPLPFDIECPHACACEIWAPNGWLSFPYKKDGELISCGAEYDPYKDLRALCFDENGSKVYAVDFDDVDDLVDPDPNAFPFSGYEDFIMGYAENPIGEDDTQDGRNYVGVLNDHKFYILISDYISNTLAEYYLNNDFGVPDSKIIFFDGGGSIKLYGEGYLGPEMYLEGHCDPPDYLCHTRKIPQAFAVYAGGDVIIEDPDPTPPINDDPCDATLLPIYFDCTPTWGDNIDATNSAIPLTYCPDDGYSYGDVWYKLTIPVTGEVYIAMDAGTIDDCAMAVFTGTCTSMTEVACDATSSPLSEYMPYLHLTDLPGGETLWIRVWEFNNNDFGTFQICAYALEDDGGGGGGGGLDIPDLHVEIISITDDDPNEGQPVTITASVDNECGSETADNSELHFYFSDDCDLDEDDDEYLGYVNTSTLDECDEDEDNFSFDIPSVSYSGTYYIIAYADGDDDVIEESEGNNTDCLEIEVTDLGVGSADLHPVWYEVHPNPASPGTEIYFEYWAQNLGGFEATDPISRFYFSTDCNYNIGDVLIGDEILPDLEPYLTDYHDSETIIIPEGTPEGDYFILIYMDPDDLIDEADDEDNNISCIPIEVSLDAYDFQPTITFLSHDTTSIGWDLDMEVFITNSSIVETDLIHTSMYLSVDTIYNITDTFLDQSTESNQPGGESWTEEPSFDIPPVPYGDYYIIAFVDNDELTLESNEENNFDFIPITIAPPIGLPDLAASIDEVDPNVFPADFGGPAAVESRVENIGFDVSTEYQQRWYLSNDCNYDIGDSYILGNTMYPLTPGDFTTPSLGWGGAVRPEGVYYVLYIVDFYNEMAEENEENNLACFPVYYANPDECAYSLTPDSNSFSADSISDAILLSTFDDCEWAVSSDVPWLNITSPLTGYGSTYINYHVEENPSPYDRVGHILLNDSIATIYQSGSTGFVDLLINVYDIEPDELEAGLSIEASTFISNVGDENVLTSNIVRYYLSSDCTISFDDIVIGFVNVDSVLAGDGILEDPTLEIPDALSPGTYYIIARVDDTGLVYELDEYNNEDCESIIINSPAMADLVCNSIIGPDSIASGEIMEITLSISNIGIVDLPDPFVELGFYINPIIYDCELDAGAIPFQTFEFAPPAALLTENFTFDVVIPDGYPLGEYDVVSYIDFNWITDEEVKTNNLCCNSIEVVANTATMADIEAVINYVSPATIFAGDEITINYTLSNIGDSVACCNFINRFKLSNDCLLLDDILLGNNTKDSIEIDESFTNSLNFTIPDTVLPGVYYILLSANATDIFPEVTLDNNKPCWGTITIEDSVSCTLELSLSEVSFDYLGGTGSFVIETDAGCGWNVESVPAWVTLLTPYSGTGYSTVIYEVSENDVCENRYGSIIVSGQIFAITQSSIDESYILSDTDANFGWTGGLGSIYVTASTDLCEWTADSPSDWVTLTPEPYFGSTTVYYEVDTNYSGPRSTTITIADNYFNVSQDGHVSISESNTSGIKIYPNPTSGTLYVELGDIQATEITVTDIFGQTVYSITNLDNGIENHPLNLLNLASSIYQINIYSKTSSYSEIFSLVK